MSIRITTATYHYKHKKLATYEPIQLGKGQGKGCTRTVYTVSLIKFSKFLSKITRHCSSRNQIQTPCCALNDRPAGAPVVLKPLWPDPTRALITYSNYVTALVTWTEINLSCFCTNRRVESKYPMRILWSLVAIVLCMWLTLSKVKWYTQPVSKLVRTYPILVQ